MRGRTKQMNEIYDINQSQFLSHKKLKGNSGHTTKQTNEIVTKKEEKENTKKKEHPQSKEINETNLLTAGIYNPFFKESGNKNTHQTIDDPTTLKHSIEKERKELKELKRATLSSSDSKKTRHDSKHSKDSHESSKHSKHHSKKSSTSSSNNPLTPKQNQKELK